MKTPPPSKSKGNPVGVGNLFPHQQVALKDIAATENLDKILDVSKVVSLSPIQDLGKKVPGYTQEPLQTSQRCEDSKCPSPVDPDIPQLQLQINNLKEKVEKLEKLLVDAGIFKP